MTRYALVLLEKDRPDNYFGMHRLKIRELKEGPEGEIAGERILCLFEDGEAEFMKLLHGLKVPRAEIHGDRRARPREISGPEILCEQLEIFRWSAHNPETAQELLVGQSLESATWLSKENICKEVHVFMEYLSALDDFAGNEIRAFNVGYRILFIHASKAIAADRAVSEKP